MKIDCHVHMVGNGFNGSGCRINVRKPYHRLLAALMVRSAGLPSGALQGDLERLYLERILRWIKESSLDRIVLLANDFTHTDQGEKLSEFGSLYVPNNLVLELARNYTEILAGVSIHPARPDAVDELERCAAEGAALLKLLPNCHNVDCSATRFKRFWRKLADLKLPFLCHTGGELALPVFNAAYANPAIVQLPLECGVSVIAAHSATNSHPLDPNYLDVFRSLIRRHSNLYGDNSGMLTPFRSKHLSLLATNEEFQGRIVHGSDLPIPNSPHWSFLRRHFGWPAYKGLIREKNPLEREVRTKSAIGFKEETLTKLSTLLPSTALREPGSHS